MKQEKNTEISARVAEIIKNEGLTANTFATKLGYTRSQTIYDILNGKSAPSYDFFRRLLLSEYSEKYSINWLITGRGEMILPSIRTAFECGDTQLLDLLRKGDDREILYSPDFESSTVVKLLKLIKDEMGVVSDHEKTIRELMQALKNTERLCGKFEAKANTAETYYQTIIKQAEEIGQLRERLEQTTRRLEKIASDAHTSSIADVG